LSSLTRSNPGTGTLILDRAASFPNSRRLAHARHVRFRVRKFTRAAARVPRDPQDPGDHGESAPIQNRRFRAWSLNADAETSSELQPVVKTRPRSFGDL
jgi:hypothetical protein